MSDLTGKVAIVTGASKGIGAAVAKTLAARGAAVVVNFASSKAGAEAVVKSITGSDGKAIAVQGDVSKAAEAKALVDAAISAYGRLDILVNNSGVYEFGPLELITEPQFRKMFDVNVLGLLLMTQAAAPHLREGASIINIGSGVTAITPPQTAVYTATKGAVDVVTGVLANELGPRKIRVNTVSPRLTETEGTHSAGMLASEFEAGIIAQTPLGRLGQPQDIADVVAFVASDDARWVTGERSRPAAACADGTDQCRPPVIGWPTFSAETGLEPPSEFLGLARRCHAYAMDERRAGAQLSALCGGMAAVAYTDDRRLRDLSVVRRRHADFPGRSVGSTSRRKSPHKVIRIGPRHTKGSPRLLRVVRNFGTNVA